MAGDVAVVREPDHEAVDRVAGELASVLEARRRGGLHPADVMSVAAQVLAVAIGASTVLGSGDDAALVEAYAGQVLWQLRIIRAQQAKHAKQAAQAGSARVVR